MTMQHADHLHGDGSPDPATASEGAGGRLAARRGVDTPLRSGPPLPSRAASATTNLFVVTTLALAVACWFFAVRQMRGMDMGVATQLGPFASFVAVWLAMMAAMMLPGAAPAALRSARASGQVRAVPLFAGSYLAVWTLAGVVIYGLYRPHGTLVAGVVAIAAGVYELTPLKRGCRRRCRERAHSGFEFGLYCLGSSVGLMLMLVALGVMSVVWMSVLAVVALAQKLLPSKAAVDVPLALAIVGLGIMIIVAPGGVPGLVPSM